MKCSLFTQAIHKVFQPAEGFLNIQRLNRTRKRERGGRPYTGFLWKGVPLRGLPPHEDLWNVIYPLKIQKPFICGRSSGGFLSWRNLKRSPIYKIWLEDLPCIENFQNFPLAKKEGLLSTDDLYMVLHLLKRHLKFLQPFEGFLTIESLWSVFHTQKTFTAYFIDERVSAGLLYPKELQEVSVFSPS